MTQPRMKLVVSVAAEFAETCTKKKMTLLEASAVMGLVLAHYSRLTNVSVDEIQAVITDMAKTVPVKK